MASFVYAVWSITNVASMHCSVRPEISPCTCEPYLESSVDLHCEKVDSFHQIVDALSNKFNQNISISLKISHSQLEDLEMRSFGEMNLNVNKLKMISNNLRSVPEVPFRGMSNIEYLSFAENNLEEIPKHVLNHLPKITTLDLGRGRIRSVNADDFKGVPNIRYLVLVSNLISRLDKDSLPKNLQTLHLGRNQIESLNGTVRDLHRLEFLFINMNNITSLENELPPASENLKMILARYNNLERLPQSLRKMPNLESLYFENNKLRSFDGVFKEGAQIQRLFASSNQIEYLAEDEFQDCEKMEELELAFNNIKSLNKSLLPMKRLRSANFSYNDLEEFSMNEITGLEYLKSFDVSYNKIEKLSRRLENLVEPNSFLVELALEHNQLKSLDGALMGLNKLRILNLSHNQIERILPDDFIGLESLEILDLSYNQLLSLEETATTFLPSLKILKAAHNNLTTLEKDFFGLPVLCHANLNFNQITSISSELVSKTRCSNHGVLGKLEIWLEHNPIMCSDNIGELCPLMEVQEARIRGRSQCTGIDSSEEICTDPPIILKAPLPLIPQIIQNQLQQSNPASPSIVQVIVPAPLIGPKTLVKAEIPTHTTSSTTPATTVQPVTAAAPITTGTSTTTTIAPQTLIEADPQTEFPTIEYSPILSGEMPPSSSETDDNHVHEQFSPIVLPAPDNSQLLSIPDEPPENP